VCVQTRQEKGTDKVRRDEKTLDGKRGNEMRKQQKNKDDKRD